MRRLETQSGFPGASSETAVVQDRWESLLGKTPRLRPWLSQMVERRRMVLAERLGRDAGAEIDRLLWSDLGRWLRDFEALPSYAVSAIALEIAPRRGLRRMPRASWKRSSPIPPSLSPTTASRPGCVPGWNL
ncbi:MAG: hypothetical protein E6J62_05075 [Deltaproteobacteria bacterium]|nr:MAG: hypothetical protein E6J62_05075 [Deltaproteobacteria bacterium]